MAKDINIHVKTKGAEQTKRDLQGVGKSASKVGDKVKTGSRKGAAAMDKLSASAGRAKGAFGKFAGSIKSWATGLIGITALVAAITSAIRIQIQAMKEHAQIASEQQKKLLELQYLGELWKERPDLRKEVAVYAEYGRRPFEEVAGAWYNLRSKAARLSDEQRMAILKESLELGRMYPSAPLSTLIDMFSLYVKQTGAQDINRVQNVLLQTITEAGGGMADVAKYMPQFLPIGMAGGLTGPQAAGLWAYVTTQLAEPSIATTGLKATFMGLQGRGTPEAQEMMQQLGITPGMNFFEKMQVLSRQQAAGRFGLAEAERFAGREGAAVLLSMLKDMPAMMETIGNIVAVTEGDRDITRTAIEGLMGKDEFARLEEHRRKLAVQIRNIRGRDIEALKWDIALKQYEKKMREAGVSEFAIQWQLLKYWAAAGVGAEREPHWLLEPPFSEFPEFPQQNRQGTPVIIHNDHSINYNPLVGREDIGGPRAGRELR